MNAREEKTKFEREKKSCESAALTFHGVEGYDVYNCSIPFKSGGRELIFGRVERRTDWARSTVRLFRNSGRDSWTLVPGSMVYQMEDPFVARVGSELVLGGVHVRYMGGKFLDYYTYFYRGVDVEDLRYFTTGPGMMKDIRLVELADGRIGVFTRPRGEEIIEQFGCESQVGFFIIEDLEQLTADAIERAPYIAGLFDDREWGGCNQAYLLESGMIGIIGHKSYNEPAPGGGHFSVYFNVSFVFDPCERAARELKIICSRSCYPAGPAKLPGLIDCAFTSGIVMRPDGKADLYSGIGDTGEGRAVIDYPFAGHGAIVG